MDKSNPKYRGPREYQGVFGARAECLCPRCGKRYKRFIYWTGRGTPRVFCQKCSVCAQHYENDEAIVL